MSHKLDALEAHRDAYRATYRAHRDAAASRIAARNAYRDAYRAAQVAMLAVETGDDPAHALLLASQAFHLADDLADAHAAAEQLAAAGALR